MVCLACKRWLANCHLSIKSQQRVHCWRKQLNVYTEALYMMKKASGGLGEGKQRKCPERKPTASWLVIGVRKWRQRVSQWVWIWRPSSSWIWRQSSSWQVCLPAVCGPCSPPSVSVTPPPLFVSSPTPSSAPPLPPPAVSAAPCATSHRHKTEKIIQGTNQQKTTITDTWDSRLYRVSQQKTAITDTRDSRLCRGQTNKRQQS